MKKLLNKELRLALSIITPLFLLFGIMTLIPGYPILMGAFFICFGIFQSFQTAREANDIQYSALLPIKKKDVVTAKYIMTVFFQMAGFLIMALLTVLRMTVLKNGEPYVNNALMAANPVFLAFALLIFTAFNVIFLRGFFKTAYYFGKPFVFFIVAAMLITGIAEALHHIPGLGWVNDISGKALAPQFVILLVCFAVYAGVTFISMKSSQRVFEKLDI
ncbi:MAG: ABC-2 transporter permease [Oscillospiraceae bacterium]|nr:ABC-2 transporter permease [Oscillospiraceae bacterium]